MSIAQWAAASVVFAGLLGGAWAFAAGDRRVAKGFVGIVLLGIVCLSISTWGPHAGEHDDERGSWHSAPLKP